MKQQQLDKVINMVRRTGDRVIIMDKDTEEVFALIDLANYEKLLSSSEMAKGLSEEEMMNKINRDIALWRSLNQSDALDNYVSAETKNQSDKAIAPIEQFTAFNQNQQTNKMPEQDKINVEESLADIPSEEEEKFYFEPIE